MLVLENIDQLLPNLLPRYVGGVRIALGYSKRDKFEPNKVKHNK